jgi:hypothetical protein
MKKEDSTLSSLWFEERELNINLTGGRCPRQRYWDMC